MTGQFFWVSDLHGYMTSERLRGNRKISCILLLRLLKWQWFKISFALFLALVSCRLLLLMGLDPTYTSSGNIVILLDCPLVLENLCLQFGECVWCVAQEIYCIFFHGGLILFLLSVNFPFKKTLNHFFYKMGNRSTGERGRRGRREQAWGL